MERKVLSFTHRVSSMFSDLLYLIGMIGLAITTSLDWISDPVLVKRMVAFGIFLGVLVGITRVICGVENYRFLRQRRKNEEDRRWDFSNRYGNSLEQSSEQIEK